MPETKITRLPKSEIKIEFRVTQDEAKPYLDEAVRDLTTAKPIPGFRPGKATYEDAKRAFGEMKIYETALERIVRATYIKTVLGEGLDTVGSPAISVEQLVPGQDIKFTAIAPVEPKVETFPDLKDCQVKAREATVTEQTVEDAVQEMRRMRHTEARVERSATEDDLVLIDLDMKKNGVPIEGGTGRDYRIYLKEDAYIPGFAKELVGVKAGDERTFTLPFPKEHYQKHLAGQPVEFTAKAKGVFEMQLPEVNDAFAKGVGLTSLEELRAKLKENLAVEQKHKSDEAAEIELLGKLTDAAKFSDIPELLVNEEVRRMLDELQHGVEDRNMKWDDYLSSIKKSADQLRLELVPQALRRIKTAVLIKALAKKENLLVKDEELDQEIDRILLQLRPDDQQARERVASPEYRDYVAVQLRNRKTLEWLKEQCVK